MREFLEQLIDRRDLTEEEAALLVALSSEQTPAAAAGGVLAALRAKGETAEEVRGFAKAIRRLALRPEIPGREGAVDVVRTGGDGSGSLNLSTGAALLAAACGQPVIKHGNRAQSSRCGSADVLEALGMELPPDGRAARQWFEKTGFTFLFAPHFHPALRTLGPVRRQPCGPGLRRDARWDPGGASLGRRAPDASPADELPQPDPGPRREERPREGRAFGSVGADRPGPPVRGMRPGARGLR